MAQTMEKLHDAQSKGVIIGLKEISGIQPRLDIDNLLLEKPNVFNLFLLALADIQSEDRKPVQDKMGYFQIAGIHGLPIRNWDNVAVPVIKPSKQAKGGYCAHSTDLFPTWHRPYVAMMEQTIFAKMLEIAEKYKDPDVVKVYRQAALEFRLPYWDYFRPRGGEVTFPGILDGAGETHYDYDFSMPKVLTAETVMVRMYPYNELEEFKNPLAVYEFPKEEHKTIPKKEWEELFKKPDGNGEKWIYSMKNTTRYPETSKPNESTSVKLNEALNKDREGKTTTFLNFLTPLFDDYVDFSNHGARGSLGRKHSSLESMHGDYHDLIGGVSDNRALMGHMGRVPVAAFDPVFWLHHCNVDRILAIYQSTHPKSWVPPNHQSEPLYPFRKTAPVDSNQSDSNFWTSNESQSTSVFGYSYPYLSSSALETRKKFEELHSWSVRKSPKHDFKIPPKEMQVLDLSHAQVFDREKGKWESRIEGLGSGILNAADEIQETLQAPADLLLTPSPKIETFRQWYIDISVLRHSQNGAFTLFYFIGPSTSIYSSYPPPQSQSPSNTPFPTADYLIKPTLAGLSHIFVAPSFACDKCAKGGEEHERAVDSTAINPMLLDYVKLGVLENLEPENVRGFLVKNLRWRVVSINQDTIPPGDEALGLDISVSCSLIRDGIELEYENYPDITQRIIDSAGT